MFTIVFTCICILIIVFESAFCHFMRIKANKNKNQNQNQNTSNSVPGDDVSINLNVKSKMTAKILNFADSFTFVFFKIVGYIPSHFIRNIIYKYIFGMNLGKNVVIYYGFEARSPWNITIGKGSLIGDKSILDARYGIEIGESVNLSTGVWIWTLQHDINSPTFTSQGTGGVVKIGNRAWISSRTTLLPGCSVAEGVVVAAGAVVTKEIYEPFTVWGGIPAKKIGTRNEKLVYSFDGKHRLFV